MIGSKPLLIVGLNDFDKHNNEPCRTLSAYQLWQVNSIFKDKNWVDAGFYFNGTEINSEEAAHFIEQFEKLGWTKNGILEFPVKIDLSGLTFNGNKEGLIYLTEESIYAQTEEFQNGKYQFEKVDVFGIPIKSDSGQINLCPFGEGFYRCYFSRDLVSVARGEYLRYSYPYGLVVRELA